MEMTAGRRQMLENFENALPWVGGGALTTLMAIAVYLWGKYFKRADQQWTQADHLLDETRRDRNYWREMAMGRQETIHSLQGLLVDHRSALDTVKEENVELRKLVAEQGRKIEELQSNVAKLEMRPWGRDA